MEHNVGEIARRDKLQHSHINLLYRTGKNVKGAWESVRKEVGRLGEESSIFNLSQYLLKMNFRLDCISPARTKLLAT